MGTPIQLMFNLEIPVSASLSGYRLVPGTDRPLGLPVEGFLRLYAVDPSGTPRLIRTLLDVLTLVQEVRSEEEAAQLLCLDTAPQTHFLFPEARCLDVRPCTRLRQPGDVIERAAFAAGYRAPTCVADGDVFRMSRDLVRLDGRPYVLVRRTEHLSRTAKYCLVGERALGVIDSSEVMLPQYE